ncbi:MAG: FecR domain-containing protein [Sinobacterium sp.]
MKNIIDFPDRGKVEQEAVDWLIKLDGDDKPSEQDLQALKQWMALSPAHIEELDKLNAFWGDLSVLTELNIPLVKPAVLAAAKNKRQTEAANEASIETSKETSKAASFTRSPWAVAASVLGLAILIQLVVWSGGKPLDSTNGYYATAIGKQTSVLLADGSTLHLNTNSQVSVDYAEGYRNIRLLQGEVHFDVAKNKAQPFRVYAGQGRVQAVGTAFTVYLRAKDIEVLVTEGKVELATHKAQLATESQSSNQLETLSDKVSDIEADNSASPGYYLTIPVEKLGLLAEGQQATIVVTQNNETGSKHNTHKVELMDAKTLARRDAWRKGLVLFAGDSLEEVVAEISRYTTLSIEIVDPALKEIRIGGQFRLGDVNGMFKVLETNFGLSVTMLDNEHVQISAAAKN